MATQPRAHPPFAGQPYGSFEGRDVGVDPHVGHVGAITQLGALGLPGMRYGSFERATADAIEITQLHGTGLPGMRYGSFAGRTTGDTGEALILTQLRSSGLPGMRYGSFEDRETVGPTPPLPRPEFAGGGSPRINPRPRRENDDEEVLLLAMV